jgi:hypothetical protein
MMATPMEEFSQGRWSLPLADELAGFYNRTCPERPSLFASKVVSGGAGSIAAPPLDLWRLPVRCPRSPG